MPNLETQQQIDALQQQRNALAAQADAKASEALRRRDELAELLAADADDAPRARVAARISALALEQEALAGAIARLDAQMVPLGQQQQRERALDAFQAHEAAIARARAARDAVVQAVGIFAHQTMPPLLTAYQRASEDLKRAAAGAENAAQSVQMAPPSSLRFVQLGEHLGGAGANHLLDLIRVLTFWKDQMAPPHADSSARATRVA